MRERIIKCMQSIGCEYDISQDKPLPEVLEDSVMFIMFIVELEREFSVKIPDDYLLISSLQTIDDVCNMLDKILLYR